MFQVTAGSLESYLRFDPDRRGDLVKVHALIRKAAPNLARYFHKGTPAGEAGMRMKMIGYGKFRYAIRNGQTTLWPVIGVALQKSYISVYVSATRGDVPVVDCYAGALGETRVGRNNFSFVSFERLNAARLFELCREVGEVFARDPENPVRYKQL
jgi:hypothetical protein